MCPMVGSINVVFQKEEKKNEERYFIDSANGFCICLVFGLCHYASNMAG
jgi:hypothetical protein